MIATIREILRFLGEPTVTLFGILLAYFWIVWGIKFICSRFYRPVRNEFTALVSVIIPTYHEDEKVLEEVINRVLQYPAEKVPEVLIITDQREENVAQTLQLRYTNEPRIRVISASPGKRAAIDIGIRSASNEILVVIESDTFVNEQTISELIKPFADTRVGGVVGDQRIYKPYDILVNFFNTLAEGIKYAITIPALSVFGKVTVLGGRCVAYRKSAVLPLLPDLVNEKFLGPPNFQKRQCISGDDGRITSLLLQAGWRTHYQSTAVVYTVSPPTWSELARQRLRWHRNSCRRTSRALLRDKLWAWRQPVVALQMLSTWTGTLMMCLVVYVVVNSMISTSWFWFGTTWEGTFARIGVLVGGITLTRVIRIHPILRYHSTRKWIYFPLFPWYLIAMWGIRLYAIATMNKQGWVTRQTNGGGGFNSNRTR